MLEVDMMSVGSEMSPLEIVFLRRGWFDRLLAEGGGAEDGAVGGVNAEDIGVLEPESGGVMFEAKGEFGVLAEAGLGL